MRSLLLLGAGHAHLVLLRALARQPLPGARVTLVTPRARQIYSAMLPGVLAGHYRREEAEIDVAALARRASVELELGRVEHFDAGERCVRLAGGRSLRYEVASINTGSITDARISGSENAIALKPFDEFVERVRATGRIAIVGAGAAGAELSMALRHRGARVTLYSDAPALDARVTSELQRRGVDFRPGSAVSAIERGPVVHAASSREAFDQVLLATGAAAPAWLRSSGLALDLRGFALVEATLQNLSHPEVFVLGDCATLRASPHPKSGVFAVRHGEILVENLRRLLRGEALASYVPQQRALLILTCGARYAIAQRGAWRAQGGMLWWLKNRIDRRWVASFSAP